VQTLIQQFLLTELMALELKVGDISSVHVTQNVHRISSKFQVTVFWVVTSCSLVVGYQRFEETRCLQFNPEGDGGSMDLRNVGILPQHYTRRYNPEDHDLKFHRHEYFKSSIKFL
jgi:hypothetical protein